MKIRINSLDVSNVFTKNNGTCLEIYNQSYIIIEGGLIWEYPKLREEYTDSDIIQRANVDKYEDLTKLKIGSRFEGRKLNRIEISRLHSEDINYVIKKEGKVQAIWYVKLSTLDKFRIDCQKKQTIFHNANIPSLIIGGVIGGVITFLVGFFLSLVTSKPSQQQTIVKEVIQSTKTEIPINTPISVTKKDTVNCKSSSV